MPNSKNVAPRDANGEPVIMGVSSQTITIGGIAFVAGETPVPIAVDPTTHEIIAEEA